MLSQPVDARLFSPAALVIAVLNWPVQLVLCAGLIPPNHMGSGVLLVLTAISTAVFGCALSLCFISIYGKHRGPWVNVVLGVTAAVLAIPGLITFFNVYIALTQVYDLGIQ